MGVRSRQTDQHVQTIFLAITFVHIFSLCCQVISALKIHIKFNFVTVPKWRGKSDDNGESCDQKVLIQVTNLLLYVPMFVFCELKLFGCLGFVTHNLSHQSTCENICGECRICLTLSPGMPDMLN
jgi:hypothetical protein